MEMLTRPRVLVIGSGIAGTISAIEAARRGAEVTLACSGHLFGGSSFFPGTWGLGLVAPIDEDDESDLIDTIIDVGCGAADPVLVKTFVRGLRPSVRWLEQDLGVKLKRPSSARSAEEVTFIPCFDHKTRTWRGITRGKFIDAASGELRRLNVTVLDAHELTDLISNERGVQGAVFYDWTRNAIQTIHAEATIVCTGGCGGLFGRRLTSGDVYGSAQGIAFQHGCRLTNTEFIQMMPGLLYPKKGLVFNEKTFRYISWIEPAGRASLPRGSALKELLGLRSTHGPFTTRLHDDAMDKAIDAAGEQGLAVRYDFPRVNVPEFVQTFRQWLQTEHGIDPSDELRLGMYAHASNGGIAISPDASTGIPGLYACGEATGGMHGADRLGGLSSANGLVFGRIAGKKAADYAEHAPRAEDTRYPLPATPQANIEELRDMTAAMQSTMSRYAMLHRTENGLRMAQKTLGSLQEHIESYRPMAAWKTELSPLDGKAYVLTSRLDGQLSYALEMLRAMRARTQSLGPHNRSDQ